MKAIIQYEGKQMFQLPDVTRNDSGFSITFFVRNEDETSLDLTGATILFKAKEINTSSNKINSSCTIVNATNGECSYTFALNDLDTKGIYDGELQVTNGTIITSAHLGRFRVLEDLPL